MREPSPTLPVDQVRPVDTTPSGAEVAIRVSVDVPEAVQAAVGAANPHLRLSDRDVVVDFLQSLDPGTAPDDERLVNMVLLWIASENSEHPEQEAWACYAATASLRLHGQTHWQHRRARLALTAVRIGILTDTTRYDQIADSVRAHIAKPGGHPGRNDDRVGNHLIAHAGLHALGLCDDAVGELTATLDDAPQANVDDSCLSSMLIVLLAALTACGRHTEARSVLARHPQVLAPTASPARNLFAECALDLMDRFGMRHRLVCTGQQHADARPYSRHAWSALLHGDDIAHHTAPRAAAATAATTPATAQSHLRLLSELPRRLNRTDALDRAPRSGPDDTVCAVAVAADVDVYLVCEGCRLALQLGVTSVDTHDPHTALEPITLGEQFAWHDADLRRALWRLLCEHRGHDVQMALDLARQAETADTARWQIIGPDAWTTELTHATYAQGPPDDPTTSPQRGATPLPAHEGPDDAKAELICQACSLELVLGEVSTHPDAPETITIGGRPCAELLTVTTAVFRFLGDHLGHDLLLTAEEGVWEEYFQLTSWSATITTGSDGSRDFGDIEVAQYIDGYPFQPSRPRYRGVNPVDPRCHAAPVMQ